MLVDEDFVFELPKASLTHRFAGDEDKLAIVDLNLMDKLTVRQLMRMISLNFC